MSNNSKLFGVGTKVKFLRTPDAGKITAKLGDGMVMVLLDDVDMEIPAFEEDLVREEDYQQNVEVKKMLDEYPHLAKQKAAAAQHPLSKGVLGDSTVLPKAISQKPTLTHSGAHIGFEMFKKSNGEVEKIDILLLNDTAYDILYEFDFVLFDVISWSKEGKLAAASVEKLGEMPFDDINDLPQLDFSVSPISTEGVGEKLFKTLKIKPKQFFKAPILSPFLNRDLYIINAFDSVLKTEEESKSDLKKYTNDILKVKKIADKKNFNANYDPVADVNEYATFINEIDLHIELLHENSGTLSNTEIINIQLRAFESFLSKALRLGVQRVYVIHGVGKGRLKEMIHARLRRHPSVEYFKNEYHERYGWGATEILL